MKRLLYVFVCFSLVVLLARFAVADDYIDNLTGKDSDGNLTLYNETIVVNDVNDTNEDVNDDNSGSGSFEKGSRMMNITKNFTKGSGMNYTDGRVFKEIKDEMKDIRDERKEMMKELRERFKEDKEEMKFKIMNRSIRFNLTEDQKLELIVGRINVKTGLNLTIDDLDNVTLGQVLRAYLSNGRWAEIKVMPDRASEIALKRLHAKCEQRNCTVELKELHNNRTNKTRIAYQVDTEKDSRLFFLFHKKMKMVAEVDAETGEIISSHKPWWSFLAREDDTSDSEIENETVGDDSGNSTSG